jgi:hypothetical protein
MSRTRTRACPRRRYTGGKFVAPLLQGQRCWTARDPPRRLVTDMAGAAGLPPYPPTERAREA